MGYVWKAMTSFTCNIRDYWDSLWLHAHLKKSDLNLYGHIFFYFCHVIHPYVESVTKLGQEIPSYKLFPSYWYSFWPKMHIPNDIDWHNLRFLCLLFNDPFLSAHSIFLKFEILFVILMLKMNLAHFRLFVILPCTLWSNSVCNAVFHLNMVLKWSTCLSFALLSRDCELKYY